MSSPLPPDPYLALGVAKDATAAVIKTTYRKLALKFHPDKVPDESQKQAAADQFHKIQTAYEIVGDEDRRARYDAQCKLAQLKKDVMERGGRAPVEVRTAAYKVPTEAPRSAAFYTTKGPERSDRASPVYEERRPAYTPDYFDPHPPVATARKDPEYERSSRRSAHPREERDRSKAQTRDVKESERLRQSEKSRRRAKERTRDRDEKIVAPDELSSGDEYERRERKMREEDELMRARARYHEQAQREKEETTHGYYDGTESARARKLYSQYDAAREHIEGRRRTDSEKRPSPERLPSMKDKVEYIKRGEGRPPVAIRRGSGRTESRRGSVRETERRSSAEIVDEPRRPPPLVQSKSMPPDLRPSLDRQRSQSVQHDKGDSELPFKMRRSETMPHAASRDREPAYRKDSVPSRSSGLRQTEIVDGQPTPGVTPGAYNAPDPRYRYQTEYADDNEFPTPDGYKTEIREPTAGSRPRYTRSPSPLPSRESRDKPRTASAHHGATPQRPRPSRETSTSYVYNPGQGVEAVRPPMNRESSSRGPQLYGEIPTTRSAKPSSYSNYPPQPESARYPKDVRPQDLPVRSGHEYNSSRRPSASTRPSYSRTGSSSVYVR